MIARRVSLVWGLGAIALLVAATELGLLEYEPGAAAHEITQQRVFGVVFAIAVALAWRSELIGGLVAAFAASALMVFAFQQLEFPYAVVVVVVFVVPGALWLLIELRTNAPLITALMLVALIGSMAVGGWMANRTFDRLFGPTHPGSAALPFHDPAVEWVWSGAVTERSAVVSAKLRGEAARARLVVREEGTDDAVRVGGEVASDADGRVRLALDGLTPDTGYRYGLEVDGELRSDVGAFRTFPTGPASFSIAVGGCARVGSNGAVFDAIREAGATLFISAGDFHYADIGEDDVGAFRDVYDHQLTRPAQAALYRSTPIAYVWDDHDFTGNDSDGGSGGEAAAMQAFREHVPHYPLAGDSAPIYQAFTLGRARVVMTDLRSARSPASDPDDGRKSMLGPQQKRWLKSEFLDARESHELIIWISSVPWISEASEGGDDWSGYATERREIADFIAANDIPEIVMVAGDAHMVAIDDGSNSDYSTSNAGGFPVLHAAALDRSGSTKGGPYSEGAFPGGGQFGLLSVTDSGGRQIRVELQGLDWTGRELVSHRLTIDAGGLK